MLSVELVILVFAVWRLGLAVLPSSSEPAHTPTNPANEATAPGALRPSDVLPTPTPDRTVPPRIITFPGASMSTTIVPAGRIKGTWETRHLGDSVGHLVGTSWLGDPGGNIVLAGHVESASGAPGPFAHLFEAQEGDLVILREGGREAYYSVTAIRRAEPDDISYVAQDGKHRITLITCTDWDYASESYLGRLIVIAEPTAAAQNPAAPGQ